MGVELDFEKINGVENSHCVINSQRCMLWLPQKGLKWERDTTRGERGQNLRFIRPFNDWEMEEIQRLISLISNNNISQREGDKKFLVSG